MKARKLFFKECRLAGRQYHDADEVWEELHVGTLLELRRDLDNRYDKDAVAVKDCQVERAQSSFNILKIGITFCHDAVFLLSSSMEQELYALVKDRGPCSLHD